MKAKNTIIVAINFDLDTKKLKDIYVQSTGKKYNHAYYDIKSFMKKNGFSHRQGSGYLSKKPTTETSATFMIKRMSTAMPWLKECVKRIDLTVVGNQHDLTGVLSQKSSNRTISSDDFPKISQIKIEVQNDIKSNSSNEETVTISKKEYEAMQKNLEHLNSVVGVTNAVFNDNLKLKEDFKKAKSEFLQKTEVKEKGGLNEKKSEKDISEHKKKPPKPKL